MKRGFLLTSAHTLVSALVPSDQACALVAGMRILVIKALQLEPYATVDIGEGGTIDFLDQQTGLVEILLDKTHKGLTDWENHIWLVPFDTDDILDSIQIEVQTC